MNARSLSHASWWTRTAEGVLVKPTIGPGSFVDKATLLRDALISIEISYLDSPSDYREAVQAQAAVPTDSSSRRRQSNRSKRNRECMVAPWALIGLVLFVVALIWIAQ
jgi:hypothetical protein